MEGERREGGNQDSQHDWNRGRQGKIALHCVIFLQEIKHEEAGTTVESVGTGEYYRKQRTQISKFDLCEE